MCKTIVRSTRHMPGPLFAHLVLLLVLLGTCCGLWACGGSGSGGMAAAGGANSASGGTGAGGATTTGSGGSEPTGGRGGSASGGRTASGGAASGGSIGTGGAATGGAGVGGAGAGGSRTGGSGSGGRAGSGGGGGSDSGGGSGSGGTTSCSRALLKNTVDAYFKALAAHSASTLPLAASVKFTENGKVTKVGDGFWKTAGVVKYAHSALDTDTCNAASEAVVPEGTTDIPFALRLKLQNDQITEIETIAVRVGDYKLSGTVYASNTAAIIASDATVGWEAPLTTSQVNTRAALTGWMEKYFKSFPRGVCNVTSDCKRLENGGGSFACTAGASCEAGTGGTSTSAIPYHLIMADVETGIGVGFDMFMGNVDMHMFKMRGGQVYAVHAILGGATSSGWD